MEYEDVKYIANPLTGENCGISVKQNGAYVIVPLDPLNTDYQNIMALVESGELTIAPATEVTDEQ